MKRYLIVLSIIVSCVTTVFAQSSDDCENECELPYSCQTLIECRVTKMRCLDSCRQRYAWIALTQAVEKFSFSLAKYLEEVSQKLDSLQQDMSAQNDQQARQISDLFRKIDIVHESLMSANNEIPADQNQSQ